MTDEIHDCSHRNECVRVLNAVVPLNDDDLCLHESLWEIARKPEFDWQELRDVARIVLQPDRNDEISGKFFHACMLLILIADIARGRETY